MTSVASAPDAAVDPSAESSAEPAERVEFRVHPSGYRHWRLAFDGPVATLSMDTDEQAGLRPGYELKLNSYDLGVDIELYDAVQRLRFEHPEVRTVVVTSGKEKIFSAGANIRMLAAAPHAWKVNFCKFTNETRNGMEDATAHSGQTYLAALNGSASGGGYELALACEHIMLVDDRSSTVSLPELPLLGVLPGTGGLTRVVDKRGRAPGPRRLLRHPLGRHRRHEGGAVAAGRRGGAAQRVGRDRRASGRPSWPSRSTRPADAPGIELTAAGQGPRRRPRSPTGTSGPTLDRELGVRRDHRARPGRRAAGRRGGCPRAGRRVLDPGGHPRAGRPDPRPAHQRDRARHLGVPHGRRRAPGAGLRRAAARAPLRLAGQRDRAVPQAHPEAAGRHEPEPDRAGRAGQLLRRLAARAGAGRRPLLPAGRGVHRGRPGRRAGGRHGRPDEPRTAADGQRADPAGHPVRRRPDGLAAVEAAAPARPLARPRTPSGSGW